MDISKSCSNQSGLVCIGVLDWCIHYGEEDKCPMQNVDFEKVEKESYEKK